MENILSFQNASGPSGGGGGGHSAEKEEHSVLIQFKTHVDLFQK